MPKSGPQLHLTMKTYPCMNSWGTQATSTSSSPDMRTAANEVLPPKTDSMSKSCYLSETSNDYIQNIMVPTLIELGTDAPLSDAATNPGMGLLLSLSEKLDSSVDTHAFESEPSSSAALCSDPFAQSAPKPTSSFNLMAQCSPSAPNHHLSNDISLLSSQLAPSFDPSSHLDSIASAASAAAATQYQEAAAFHERQQYQGLTPQRTQVSPRLSPAPGAYTFLPTPKPPPSHQSLARRTSNHDFSMDTHKLEDKVDASSAEGPTVTSSIVPHTSNADFSLSQALNVQAHSESVLPLSHPSSVGITPRIAPMCVGASGSTSLDETTKKIQAQQQQIRTALGQPTDGLQQPFSTSVQPEKRSISTSTDDAKRVKTDTDIAIQERSPKQEAVQKRFQCPKCFRAFARAYNLSTHLSTHDPDPSRAKPFPCPYRSCRAEGGRSFSRKHDLQRHVASVHEWEPEPGIHGDSGDVGEGQDTGGLASLGLGTPGKKFRCEQCGRAFVRRDALRRHHCDAAASRAPLFDKKTTTAVASVPMPPSHSSASVAPARALPGDVMQRVTLQLMNKADPKAVSAFTHDTAAMPMAPRMDHSSDKRADTTRMQQSASSNIATASAT